MRRRLLLVLAGMGAAITLRILVRRVGPGIALRCEEMFRSMPEDAPPTRLFADVAAIREQSSRILEILERERQPA